MRPVAVCDYLRSGGTLADLAARFAIKATRGRVDPNLILLKYNQLESPFSEPMVRECRGLVLDEADGWRVVSRSFDKFFNHGEGHAAPINWGTAQVQEKLDGSLCVLYWYDGAWRVQTSGTPDASGRVGDTAQTFADLFWEVFRTSNYRLPDMDDEHWCFAFELCTKHNRVVCIHERPRLVLLAARHRVTGAEAPLTMVPPSWRWERVQSFPLQSIDDVMATFATMEPLRQEGYVVVDGAFNRVKVKHPGYVAIHHLKEGHSTRRLVEIVQAGEVGELITYFPEWREEFAEITGRLDALTVELEAEYARLRDIPVQKDFALEAVKTRCPAALFAVRAQKAQSVRAFLSQVTPDSLIKTLGIRNVEAQPADEAEAA